MLAKVTQKSAARIHLSGGHVLGFASQASVFRETMKRARCLWEKILKFDQIKMYLFIYIIIQIPNTMLNIVITTIYMEFTCAHSRLCAIQVHKHDIR